LRSRYLDRLKGQLREPLIEPLVDRLFIEQRITAKRLQTELGYASTSAHRTLAKLEQLGLVVEWTGHQRNRIFVAREIISILDTTV
jgi:hypothetical protein